MLTAIIADDLTGAADTGMQFARAGYRTAVAFRDAEINLKNLDAVALDTDSRTIRSGQATKRVARAVRKVRHSRILYKKIDSTLRGNVAAELAAAFEASGRERAIVAPAFPDTGRTTAGGVQFVGGVPVHETGMAKDPKTPVVEGHIPTLLSAVFPVGVIGAKDAGDPKLVERALEKNRCVVADARSNTDLDALVRTMPDVSKVLWAGSAGLAMALARQHPGPSVDEEFAAPAPARGVLVVIGSLNAASREQLRLLVAERGAVAAPVAGRAGIEDAFLTARAALEAGGCAVLHSPGERMPSDSGPAVNMLADVAARLAREGLFDALVATGGSTAVAVSRRLGASGIMLDGEVEAGVPVGTLIGRKPYRIVTKAGGFGNPDTLVRAVEKLEIGEE